jgi:hypothetical protein
MKLTGNPARACRIVKPIWPPVIAAPSQEEAKTAERLAEKRRIKRRA